MYYWWVSQVICLAESVLGETGCIGTPLEANLMYRTIDSNSAQRCSKVISDVWHVLESIYGLGSLYKVYLNSSRRFSNISSHSSGLYICLNGLFWCYIAFFGTFGYLLLPTLLGDIWNSCHILYTLEYMPGSTVPEWIQPGRCMGGCEMNIIVFSMIFDFWGYYRVQSRLGS